MAITFVTSALSGTTDSTTLNITLPTVQADDIMLLEYTHRSTGTGTLGGVGGSGWSTARTLLYSADAFSVHLYWKRCDGSESGDALTVTGLTNSCAGCVTLYRGAVLSGDPVAAFTGESNASGDESHAAITAPVDGCWIVLTVANSPDLAITSQTCTSPGTLTERAERLNTTGTDTSITHASAEKAAAGSTGALTWTQTNGASGSFAYALLPSTPVSRSLGLGSLVALGLSVGAAFSGPAVGAVGLTGYAPVAAVSSGTTISLPAGSVSLSGTIPVLGRAVAVPAGSAAVTGHLERLALTGSLDTGALTLTGAPPVLGRSVALPAGTLTLAGQTPSLAGHIGVPVPVGTVTYTGELPAVSIEGTGVGIPVPVGSVALGGLSVGIGFTGPSLGQVALTGYAPVPAVTGGTSTIPIPAGTAILAGLAPTIDRGLRLAVPAGTLAISGQYVGVAFLQPAAGSATYTGYAPEPTISGFVNRAMPSGVLTVTGTATVLARTLGSVPAGTLTLTGTTATVVAGTLALPLTGSVTLTGTVPTLGRALALSVGSLTVTGTTPGLLGGGFVGVPAGSVVLTGHAPVMHVGQALPVPSGALSLTGTAPVLARTLGVPAGVLTLTGRDTGVNLGGVLIQVPSGAVTTTGVVLTRVSGPTLEFPVGTVTCTGYAPTMSVLGVVAGTLTVTGRVPALVITGPPGLPFNAEPSVEIDIQASVMLIDIRPRVGIVEI